MARRYDDVINHMADSALVASWSVVNMCVARPDVWNTPFDLISSISVRKHQTSAITEKLIIYTKINYQQWQILDILYIYER